LEEVPALKQLEKIMFARLLTLYPTGCLISDLLQNYQGKFVVRVEVQVDSVTRATGLACAETLELAEDRARSRALMVLLPDDSSRVQPELSAQHPSERSETQPVVKQSLPYSESELKKTSANTRSSAPNSSTISSFAPVPTVDESTLAQNGLSELAVEDYGSTVAPAEVAGDKSVSAYDPQQEFSEKVVIPFGDEEFSESYDESYEKNLPEPEPESEPVAEVTEAFDLSDAIAQTSIQLKRLGWNNQQGRKYLEQTYGKRSRHELDDTEMLSFLTYLSSQPSPDQ